MLLNKLCYRRPKSYNNSGVFLTFAHGSFHIWCSKRSVSSRSSRGKLQKIMHLRAEQLAWAAVATTAEQTKKASPTGLFIQGTRRHGIAQIARLTSDFCTSQNANTQFGTKDVSEKRKEAGLTLNARWFKIKHFKSQTSASSVVSSLPEWTSKLTSKKTK